MSHLSCAVNRLFIPAILVMIFTLSGCGKEQSFETPIPGSGTGAGNGGGSGTPTSTTSGTARFTIVPLGSACSDATVFGNFVEKRALTPLDFVMVTVDVSNPGTWTFATSSVNGFKLSGTGNFTTTGKQQIVLFASGTPISAGNAEFPLSIGSANCKINIIVSATGGGNGSIGEYYYKANIGGIDYGASVTATGEYEAGSGLGGHDEVIFGAGINPLIYPIRPGLTAFGVDKGLMRGYLNSTNEQFRAFFPVGSHPYRVPGDKNGITLSWTDKQGRYWSSLHETLKQPATSSFKIISVQDDWDPRGILYLRVKMQFNAVMFLDSTDTKVELKNGEMVGLFGKI
jgi:hypothetical protein